MFHYEYKTSGTCSQLICIDIEGDVVKDVKFTGGCNGNLKAVSALVKGLKIDEVENRVGGITCSGRPTSCADQLAKALRCAYAEQEKANK